jgi:hypothetical protein
VGDVRTVSLDVLCRYRSGIAGGGLEHDDVSLDSFWGGVSPSHGACDQQTESEKEQVPPFDLRLWRVHVVHIGMADLRA